MPNTKKIYVDDPLIKFKGTTVPAVRSRQLIDMVLAEYSVKDVMWHYDPPNSIFVLFKIQELINDVMMTVSVRVDCPTIWNKAQNRRRPFKCEEINLDVSMRAMYHFIYTHLNAAYAMQSSNTVAFLGFIQTNKEGVVLKDLILPKLNNQAALENKLSNEDESKIIDVTPKNDDKIEEHNQDVQSFET